jgi:hypothetical protein
MDAKDKAGSFKRLAVARTNRAIDAIRLVGNLSGGGYESTEDQREAVFGAIRSSLAEAESRFAGKTDANKFEL